MVETESELIIILGELEEGIGKAVQLYVHETPFLILGDSEDFQHGDLLDKALEDMKIPFDRTKLRDGKFHAKERGESYMVAGMGYSKMVCEPLMNISLFGESGGYGIRIDENHAEDLNSRLEDVEVCIGNW